MITTEQKRIDMICIVLLAHLVTKELNAPTSAPIGILHYNPATDKDAVYKRLGEMSDALVTETKEAIMDFEEAKREDQQHVP